MTGLLLLTYSIRYLGDIYMSDKKGKPLPKGLKQEHYDYLEDLRESGETNMFGAGDYVRQCFDTGKAEADTIVLLWMGTYDE